MFRAAVLTTALLLGSLTASAQKFAASAWDVFGGVAVMRSSSIGTPGNYAYGWSGSVANRPYESHRWIGGVVEGTGIYNNGAGKNAQGNYTISDTMYTAMGGPVVTLPHRYLRPFAHVLVGAAIVNQSMTTFTSSIQTSNNYFAQAAGGGLDFGVTRHVLVRTQADWIHVWQTSGNNDSLRLCGGLVWSY